MNYAQDRMFARQKDIYSRRINNASKCITGGGMVLALHYLLPLWPKQATCDTYVCHNMGERLGRHPLKRIFQGQ